MWLTRTNWATGDPVAATDLDNFGLDIRTQGSDADAGQYGRANIGWLGFTTGDLLGTAYTVTNATWATGTATITIGANNIVVNQTVVIASVNPTGYNVTGQVTGLTGSGATAAIQVAIASNPGTYVSGGTVTVSTASGSGPSKNMVALSTTSVLQVYNGTAWAAVAGNAGSVYSTAWNQTATITIPTSTSTALTLDANIEDSGSVHSVSVNNTRFTAPVAGRYYVSGGIAWQTPVASMIIQVFIDKNRSGGTYVFGRNTSSTSVAGYLTTSEYIQMNANDYVEIFCYQTSGSNLVLNKYQSTYGQIILIG